MRLGSSGDGCASARTRLARAARWRQRLFLPRRALAGLPAVFILNLLSLSGGAAPVRSLPTMMQLHGSHELASTAIERGQFVSAVAQRMGVMLGDHADRVARALHYLASGASSSDEAPLPVLNSSVRSMFAEVCLDRLEAGCVPPWSQSIRPLQDAAHAEQALAQIVSGPLAINGCDRSWLALLKAHLIRVYRRRDLTEADLAADQRRYPDVGTLLLARGWHSGYGTEALGAGSTALSPNRDWNVARLRDILAVVQPYVRVAIWDAVRLNGALNASASEAVMTERIVSAVGGLTGFLSHTQVGNLGLFHLVHSHLVNTNAPPERTISESRRLILDWAMQNFS